jgi:aldehyde:ferredoxin oxidoreductase
MEDLNMKQLNGYLGKIGLIDLTNNKVIIKEFDNSFARKWLGGAGFGISLISDYVSMHDDPLGPKNMLVFSTGPFTGTPIIGSGKIEACSKSPLTGYWGESNGGGHAGPSLKNSGFDAIAIVGRAKRPSYLYINDGKIEIRNATQYWGMDTVETYNSISKDIGEKLSIMAIGPAGENLVKYSMILADKHGAMGRTGMGAVMGSKNLKAIAIAINPTLNFPVKDIDNLKQIHLEILKKVNNAPFTKEQREHGEPNAIIPREKSGLLPIKNWNEDTWEEGAKKIGAPFYTEELKIKPWPCENCIIGCHRKITNPAYFPAETVGPEYETLAMLGSNLLIDNLKDLVRANENCNRLGIDTIETGAVLGWAFESYEKGIINKDDTGIELKWGSGEALNEMIIKIAKRDGIGNLFAEGITSIVEHYPETKGWAVEVLGMSVAAHDPRAYFAQVITTIASTRGSCHIHGFAEAIELGVTIPELGAPVDQPMDRFEYYNKGVAGAIYQDIQEVWNSLILCMDYYFSGITLNDQAKILNTITGWDTTPQELRKIGERIVNAQHLFNLKMGLIPEREFVLPERFLNAHKSGGAAGKVPPWQYILEEYYKERKWIKGIPSKDKLKELGLDKN